MVHRVQGLGFQELAPLCCLGMVAIEIATGVVEAVAVIHAGRDSIHSVHMCWHIVYARVGI